VGLNNDPLVSVVIPTYNCAGFIGGAIQSVLDQTRDDFEIIVIDDGSTDDTVEVVGQFAERIRYLRQANRGVAAARNYGIRSAGGRIIGFLDADDRWKPDKLERQAPVLLSADDIDVVFSRHENLGRETAGYNQYDCPDLTKLLTVISLGPWAYRIEDTQLFQKILRYYLLLTSTVLIKKSCIERVGGFDETLGIAEDTQLWLRLAKRGKIAFVDLPLVEKRLRGESLTGDQAKFIRQITVMFQQLEQWLPDLNRDERAAVKDALDYWYAKAYRLFCDGDKTFGPAFFWKAFLNDRRPSAPGYLLAATLPDPVVQMGWQLDRRLRWYGKKTAKGFRRFGESARR
jgi:glycosyltransferase involved in cell wall biosynthesis